MKIKRTSVHHFNTGHCILSYVVLTVVYSVETLTGIKFIGDFCKKSRSRSIFVFPCLHFGAYGFCISSPGNAQRPLNFFFQM
jgi:hypothetical protein